MQCPRCRHESEAEARFCGGCGAPLAGDRPERRDARAHATPRHLAEKILTARSALEGERKQVTVLCADVEGSLGLLANRDPEEARKLLDPVIERMIEAVHRYEGTVNQVMGDGIMALFGAPLAHEDHAVRACYAALSMQEAVAAHAEALARTHGLSVQIRQGLNSGEVVVRGVDSDLRMDYSAVGHTTQLAARMEQLAAPGTILIGPSTRDLVEGYVELEARGPAAVAGLAEPVAVYALTGARPRRSRLRAAADRGLARFVGREAQIAELRAALGLALSGHGQLVAVVGDPGVGKSRLVHELIRAEGSKEWLVLEASAVSYGKRTSYLPVIDLLKAYFEVHDRATRHEIRDKVTARVRALDPALEPILSAVLALLDVPVEDAQWQALDPPQRRQRTLGAVKHLLLRESRQRPVLVVLEDLHWVDSETEALIDSLVESLPTARLLVLISYRPEYRHGWSSKTFYGQLRLDSLPPERAGELLTALVGADPGLEPLTRLLIRRGNPFFIEESIRTLVETRTLVGEPGAYRLARPIQSIEIPATVQVILAARIDRLPPEDKQLLQTASAIGRDVPLPLLHAAVETGAEAVQRGLAHLQAAEFLYETALFPDPQYTFTHALTHEVAYGTMLQTRRRALHARIVGALERVYADRLTEHVERLAHHATRGELWAPAAAYLGQAGAKALARSANREAVTCFEQALTALGHLPETRDAMEHAIDLRFDLRTALFPLGEFGRIFGCLSEAEGLARALGDQRRLGRLSVYLCHNLYMTGRPREALPFGQGAVAIAEALGDFPLRVAGTLYLGVAHLGTGDYPEAEARFRAVLGLLEGPLGRERLGLAGYPAVLVRYYLGWILAEQGRFEEGIAHGRDGVRLAEALDHPYSLALVSLSLAYLQITRGEFDEAVGVLDRVAALSAEWSLAFLSAGHAASRGYAYALSGRLAEGIPLLEHAVRAIESMEFTSTRFPLTWLSEACLLADRPDAAGDLARRALAQARACGQRSYEAWARRLLGEVAARRGAPAEAAGHLEAALDLARALGMRPLAAHCHLSLGHLQGRTGEAAEGAAHLARATELYRAMGMRFWLGRAGPTPSG